ncbi:hypothetical protein [Photobacterium sp. J15]|uniref:hypothetical protein n=1 Tax=Photobacterium sp. J15 TaxID=265901 RepID=UPI0007E3558E|nr:hypothetical protein [Photobacterium sp. J15]
MKLITTIASLFAAFLVNAANFNPLNIGCDVKDDTIKLVIANNTSHHVKLNVVTGSNNRVSSGSSGNSVSSLSFSKSDFPVELSSTVSSTFVIDNNCFIAEKNAS